MKIEWYQRNAAGCWGWGPRTPQSHSVDKRAHDALRVSIWVYYRPWLESKARAPCSLLPPLHASVLRPPAERSQLCCIRRDYLYYSCEWARLLRARAVLICWKRASAAITHSALWVGALDTSCLCAPTNLPHSVVGSPIKTCRRPPSLSTSAASKQTTGWCAHNFHVFIIGDYRGGIIAVGAM